MRSIPQSMFNTWQSGDFSGANRPMVRVTVAHPSITLHEVPLNPAAIAQLSAANNQLAAAGVAPATTNTYASLPFGAWGIPIELPNVKSWKWTRATTQDIATGILELYNTKPALAADRDQLFANIDLPGYYSPGRGNNPLADRTNQKPNEFAGMLVPDNVIRTYEGYGFDARVCAEKDPNLVITGTWLINDVTFDAASGLITINLSDFGRILADQIVMPPVIPDAFYPLTFSSGGVKPGFNGPKVFTFTVDSAGHHDPAHPPPDGWVGPFNPPTNVHIVNEGARDVCVVGWSPPSALTFDDGHSAPIVADPYGAPSVAPTDNSAVKNQLNQALATAQSNLDNNTPVPDDDNAMLQASNINDLISAVNADNGHISELNTYIASAQNDANNAKTKSALDAANAKIRQGNKLKTQYSEQLTADQNQLTAAQLNLTAYRQLLAQRTNAAAFQAALVNRNNYVPTATYGYHVDGYQLVIDDIVTPEVYPPDARQATVPASYLIEGVEYAISVVAIWQEELTTEGEVAFMTNVLRSEISDFASPDVPLHPGAFYDSSNNPIPPVEPGDVALNIDVLGELNPNYVRWHRTRVDTNMPAKLPAGVTYILLFYRNGQPPADTLVFHVHVPAGAMDLTRFRGHSILGRPPRGGASDGASSEVPGRVS